MQFCKEVASYLGAHPDRADEPAIQRLRRFCGGLDAHLDHVSRNGATSASDMGMHYYDSPPLEYPRKPPWPPVVPVFHATLRNAVQAPPSESGSLMAGNATPVRSFL
eukprot:UN0963